MWKYHASKIFTKIQNHYRKIQWADKPDGLAYFCLFFKETDILVLLNWVIFHSNFFKNFRTIIPFFKCFLLFCIGKWSDCRVQPLTKWFLIGKWGYWLTAKPSRSTLFFSFFSFFFVFSIFSILKFLFVLRNGIIVIIN